MYFPGGMLLVKLDVDDLQFEKMSGSFEGTMVYAQNKRQQVIMTEQWAEMYKSTGIHFSSMHPGNKNAIDVKCVISAWGVLREYEFRHNFLSVKIPSSA